MCSLKLSGPRALRFSRVCWSGFNGCFGPMEQKIPHIESSKVHEVAELEYRDDGGTYVVLRLFVQMQLPPWKVWLEGHVCSLECGFGVLTFNWLSFTVPKVKIIF